MSKYEMTHEELDHLQDQVQQLTSQNDAKQKRIRELELFKASISNSDTADLIMTIARLENEIGELKKANECLTDEICSSKTNVIKLEKLLEEERKLRKYAETFAKEMEFKRGEESLHRQLTSELCQLQKTEIDIDNERIEELQKKLNKLTNEFKNRRAFDSKEIKESVNMQNIESSQSIKQLKLIVEQLKTQLLELRNNVGNSLVKTSEDKQHLEEIGKWLRETKYITADVKNIEILGNELKYLGQEIEIRRKSILK